MEQFKSLQEKLENSIQQTVNSKIKEDIVNNINQSLEILKVIYQFIDKENNNNSTDNNQTDSSYIKDYEIISNKVIEIFEKYLKESKVNYTICISLSKLIDLIFTIKYYDYISKNDKNIISFINICITLINNIKGSLIYQKLVRKYQLYMNYIYQKRETIKKDVSKLMNNFHIYRTEEFKNFSENFNKSNISELCASYSCKDKEKGIDLLIELISSTNIFSEQFELLYLSAPEVLNNLLKDPSEDCNKAYIKFGNLLCTLIFVSKYKIYLTESDIQKYDLPDSSVFPTSSLSPYNDDDDIKEKINSKSIFDFFSGTDSEKINLKSIFNIFNDNDNENVEGDVENVTYILDDKIIEDINELEYLKESKYEVTYQKDILELNEKIVEICITYVQAIIKYEKIFPLQYICYLVLRRVYFAFPQCKNDISKYLITALSNLCKFQGQFEWNTSLECRHFSYYLLANDKELSSNITSATAVPPYDITFNNLILEKPNLNIGFSSFVEIPSGEMTEKIIEINHENTLVFISYGMEVGTNKTINIIFLKFDYGQKKWASIFSHDDAEFTRGHEKILLFAKNVGLYKIVFDNTSSWFLKKKIIYKFVFLKLLNN